MAFIYDNSNIYPLGDFWADPTKGGTVSGPITVTTEGIIFGDSSTALQLWDGNYGLTNSGTIASTNATGIFLGTSGGLHASKVTNTASGYISGATAIYSEHNLSLSNAGVITGGTGIEINGSGSLKCSISNAAGGVIEGTEPYFIGPLAIYQFAQSATVLTNKGSILGAIQVHGGNINITNTGTIDGRIYLDAGLDDVLKNSGLITKDVELGAGVDKLTNTGTILGEISLWDGNDVFMGGKGAETLRDEAGADSYKFGDGVDHYKAVATGSNSKDGLGNYQVDIVDGGSHTGIDIANGIYGDIYDASETATTGVFINLDKVSHDNAAANTASGDEIGIDKIKGFEEVRGSDFVDWIYGDGSANKLVGNLGNDRLFGLAGNDLLLGGNGQDFLTGGVGADRLTGGNDNDTFTYRSLAESTLASGGRDIITDFTDNNDIIDLNFGIGSLAVLGVNAAFNNSPGQTQVRPVWTSFGWMRVWREYSSFLYPSFVRPMKK